MSKENFQKELRLLAEDMVKQYAYTKELDAMVRPLDNPMNRRDFTKIEKDAWEDFGDRIQKIYEKYKNEPFFRDEQPLKNSYPESVWLYAKTYCEDLPESYWVNRETKEKISNSDMWKGLEIDEQPDTDLFKKVVRPDITSAIEAQETIIQELCESGNFEDLSSKFTEIKDSANLMQQKTTLAYGTSEDFRKWASGVRAEERKPTKEEYDIVSTEALAMGRISEGTVDPKLELEAPEKETVEKTGEVTETLVESLEKPDEQLIPRPRQNQTKAEKPTESYFSNEDKSLLQGIDLDETEEDFLIESPEDETVGETKTEEASFIKPNSENKERSQKIEMDTKEDRLDQPGLQSLSESLDKDDISSEVLNKDSVKPVKDSSVFEKTEDQTIKRDNPSQDSVRDILEIEGVNEVKEAFVNVGGDQKAKADDQDFATKTLNKEPIKKQAKSGKEEDVESLSHGDSETVSMSEALGLTAPIVAGKKEPLGTDEEHIPHGMGLNESGAGGALNEVSKKTLNSTEEVAKQASEGSKTIQKHAKNLSVKDRLNKLAENKDWTDVVEEAKKAEDGIWNAVDGVESVSSQFVNGIKNGIGNDHELKSAEYRSEFEKNEQELQEAEKFTETGADKAGEEGKGFGRKIISAPSEGASKAAGVWNKKKQVEEKVKKFKEKKAERLKAKEAAQQQAVEAQNTAKMAQQAKMASQGGSTETSVGVSQATAAQVGQEVGKNMAVQSSVQAAEGARRSAQAAGEVAKTSAETTASAANTATTTTTVAAEAGSGPVGWIMLIVELVIVILSLIVIMCVVFSIFMMFTSITLGGEDEDGLATSEQRVEFQTHMFRMLAVYHEAGKNISNYDAYYNAALACAEFDSSVVDYNNIYLAAKTAYRDDEWGELKFHPKMYSVISGIDNHWCAVFATYVYRNGGFDHTLDGPTRYLVYDGTMDYVHQGYVTSGSVVADILQGFIEKGHAIPYGPHLSPGAKYIPTVGDSLFRANDKTWELDSCDWHIAPSHIEIVIAVNYNTGDFYTINGNNGAYSVGLRKYNFNDAGTGSTANVCAFGRVFSKPEAAYSVT